MDITERDLPETALHAYHLSEPVTYTDCFTCKIDQDVDLQSLIVAFYTSWIFKAERVVLRFLARAPSNDADVMGLASGASTTLAVWKVEARTNDQIVLDAGRTKSWLHVAPSDTGTRLFFGSVVVPEPAKDGKPPRMGPVFETLIMPHKFYSRLLLGAAMRRLAAA